MRTWIAGGVVAGWVAGATGADPVPVSVYPPLPSAALPGTVVPAPTYPVAQQAPDVTRPLSSVLDAAPPAMPAYPGYTTMPTPAYMPAQACGPCDTGGFPRSFARGGWKLDKVCNWFAWKQGPRVVPAFTPTPYQPPLRQYLPAPKAATGAIAPESGNYPGPAPLFGQRMLGRTPAAAADCNSCGKTRCDGCTETLCDKALGCVTPRQFGRLLPQCWVSPRAPGVSACAQGDCHGGGGHAGVVAPSGGVVYPGVGGGYRFASSVYVPPAPPINASMGGVVSGGGVGAGTSTAAVGGNVGAVGTGAPGAGVGGK